MTEKQFAAALKPELDDAGYGFDPTMIITLLTLLMPIIQNLPCFKKSKKVVAANIDSEFRDCCKKKRGRCPLKARRAMKDKLDMTDKDEQDDVWACVCKVAFANRDAVAAKLVAA